MEQGTGRKGSEEKVRGLRSKMTGSRNHFPRTNQMESVGIDHRTT
jgi:hypothetical protein